jgi:hypothetical protein
MAASSSLSLLLTDRFEAPTLRHVSLTSSSEGAFEAV